MPIRSIDELRNWAGPDWKSASDEDLISMYSRAAKVAPTEVAMTLGYDPGSGGISAKQLSSSVDRYQAGLYGVGEAVTGAIGLNKASGWLAEQRRANELQADVASARAREMGAVDSWKDVKDVGDFGSYAKSLAIQSLPYAGEAMVGGIAARGLMSGTRAALTGAKTVEEAAAAKKALDLGSTVGGVAASYPSALGDILSNQREQSGKTDLLAAAGLAVPYAALNAVGVESAVMRGSAFKNTINLLDRPGGILGAAARTTATATGVGLKEGISETGQEVLNQAGRMAVDPNATLTDPEALERYKESFVGGATLGGLMGGGLGGWRRNTPATNDIQQAFDQPNVSGTPTTNVAPPPAFPTAPANHPDPMARLAELEAVGKGTPARTVEGPDGQPLKIPATEGRFFTPEEQQEYKALKAQVANMTPPAVTGGTTDIAQQTQAAVAQNQQADQAQQNLAKREEVFGKVATQYDPANPTSLNIFGQNIEGPRVETFGNRFATVFNTLPPHVQQLAQAITQANKTFATPEKPSPLVSFSFNANNPVTSAEKALEALGKVMTKFQIDHVQSLDEAVQILNKLSTTTKGNQLEQLNAIYEAITGQDTDGFTAAQATKAEKETKNGKLSQQATTGVGAVSVEGGAGQANDGNDGNVQSSNVQSVGAGSLPAGSFGLQTGQQAGEGIRTGPSQPADIRSSVSAQDAEINSLLQQTFGGERPQGALDEEASQTGTDQSGQPSVSAVAEPAVAQSTEPRKYNPQISYYATDLSHISSTRRVEIRDNLIRSILAPKQEKAGGMTLQQRVEMVTMALTGGDTHADIADRLKVPETTIAKQLQRLGIVIKPRFTEAQQTEVTSIEQRLGIPEGTHNTTKEKFAVSKAMTADLPVEEAATLVGRLNELYQSAGRAYGIDAPTEGKAFDDLLLDAASAYRSPEFPDGIGAGEIAYLYSHDRNVTTKETAADQQAKEMGAATAEQLEEAGFGTIATGGGSQGAVGTQATSLFKRVEKLQNELASLEKGTPEYTAKAEQLAELWTKYAKQQAALEEAESTTAEEGDENAVQVESTDEGNVREPAGGGEAVGKGNAKSKKSAGKAKAKVEPKQEAKPEEIKTPAEEWADLSKLAPEIPPYDVLTNSEKSRWDDLVRRGQANLAAAVKIIGESTQPAGTTVANEKPKTTGTDGTAEAVTNKEEIPAPKPTLFSKAESTPEAKNSVYNIWNTLLKLFDVVPADSAYKDFIRVSQTAKEAYEAAGKKVPLAQLQNAQAFIDPTDDRIVHLIADNIAKGSELAVLLHEVGVHVGLKKKLGANFKILEGQVKAWANSPKGSLERQVYERAMARVAAARMDGAVGADIAAEELVAYAAEEAALAGVKVKDAPRSRLETWVKQLHDIASQAFKNFFKLNNIPELSVQDLVNFSFAAAQEHMQAYRSEIGATVNATESQIAKYYAGARGTYEGTSVVENEDRPGPGEESFFWSPADKFGSFTGIGTRGFYSPANSGGTGPRGVGAPEYAAMVVTSAESRAFGDEQKNNQDKVLLTFQATRDRRTNIWSLIVSGPDIDSALYVDLYVEGLATTTKDNEGNQWSRLEGISGRDNLRLLGEFRRRLTRMKNGEIPNIDFVRVTGSGATKDEGRPGVYAADTLATRFSKAPTVDRIIGAMPKPLQKSTRGIVTNLLHQAKRGLYASAITEDLANMAKKYMPSVSKYLQAQYARQATRLNFEKRIENILAAYDKLPENFKGEGKGSVNEFIHDSTREKKWGYYPGEQQVGTKLFTIDEDFKKRFDAFPSAAQQIIKDVFQHGYDALRLKQQAAENAVNREFDDRIKAAGNDADLLQQIAKEKKQAIKRITNIRNVQVGDPYAYLGRYGDYVVVAKSKEFIAYEEAAKGTQARVGANYVTGDPQQAKNWLQENVANPMHYVVQFAETQAEADEIADKLQATGQYDIQPEDAGVKEANASYFGGSDVHLAVARLRNLAQRQTESTDAKLDKAIADLYLMTVADASARASELQRKNVAGADKNMMRNLATSGRADAHFLASMEHSDEISDALEAMRNEARNDRREAMPMYNELYIRHANSMDYQPVGDLATALTRMTTLWTLSTNPAFYLQQVLQTSVLSLPFMAGRLGYFRSARAIKRAYGDMSELVKGLGINEHIDFTKAPADVRNMLNTLVGMGKIDLGIDAEAKARTDEQGVLGKVMLKLQGVNTRIEAINRATAAIAAYRGYLERYKNGDTAAATKYAADVVSNTHGSYDGFNTPRVLQGGVSKVALQFKRFQIIQLSMLAKLIHTSFKGASAEEKAVARASLKFITAHMAVLGGALGVPFVSQAAWILSKVFGDDDEPDDYEYKLRRMIGDGPAADLLLRGVPAAIGLESLGKKLSMENVASPFGPFVEPDLTSRSGAEKMLVGMMGPAANIGLKFTDALGMMTKGDYYKGLELALPNGVANAMKAYRFSTEGITMRNGDLVMKPEDISLIDAAFQAVGLPTTTITDRQYTQKVIAEFDKFYAERAKEIKASYVEGSRASDSSAMAEAREDWQKLQESRTRNGYKRQSMSELFRAPVEARKRERGVVGGVETTKSNRRFVEQVSSVS
jgi:hypothetical protein